MSETRTTAKLTVDPARCEGHARCLLDAPVVFGYGDVSNQAFVLPDADLEANRDAIELAIQGCPEQAISWGDAS
jgi:ferredoxin